MSTRGWAYAALIVGLCATLAANVAHAVQRDDGNWHAVPVAAAGFWPVALFLMFELLCRLRFDSMADYVSAAMVATVGLGAGYISYGHTRALLRGLGESETGARLGALAVDGVLVAASLAAYREAQRAAVPAVPAARPVPRAVPRAAVPAVRNVPGGTPVPPVRAVAAQAAQRHGGAVTLPVPPVPGGTASGGTAAQADPVQAMRAEGMSVRAIAARLELSPSTVQRRLGKAARS